ncbi:hypothetical protein FR483_n229R [Paramecium bursaria Chlorella virus FR483]|uniref:Uncharacterized protein n229R n=1 Tax=Paramecium bursaria Chlorella virus FR483 TaxID=399781 RepID=A7J6T3_PBCVF|nr:hypothetical protein FR483_n229R [Paramecium bursaria Chlorella virus FR483]ABT15514.1 hypothetical protein FR483_n229R [Paramecium bursaria Chlorella virus FR483]
MALDWYAVTIPPWRESRRATVSTRFRLQLKTIAGVSSFSRRSFTVELSTTVGSSALMLSKDSMSEIPSLDTTLKVRGTIRLEIEKTSTGCECIPEYQDAKASAFGTVADKNTQRM